MDRSFIDLGDSAVWRLIRPAKWRGYITYDKLNRSLLPENFSAELIEHVLEQLSVIGIRAVDSAEVVGSAIPLPANSKEPPPESPSLQDPSAFSSPLENQRVSVCKLTAQWCWKCLSFVFPICVDAR